MLIAIHWFAFKVELYKIISAITQLGKLLVFPPPILPNVNPVFTGVIFWLMPSIINKSLLETIIWEVVSSILVFAKAVLAV